jgi:hypothetical protein
MRTLLLVAVGMIVGAVIGWHARSLLVEPVRPSSIFAFNDRLADTQVPYLMAKGTWRGTGLAPKVNTVRILCDGAEKTCDMHQAHVESLGSTPFLSLYSRSFKITHLDTLNVTAVESLSSECVRQTLMIDRQAKAITLIRTKISKEGACAAVQDEPLTLSLIDGRARSSLRPEERYR